jgi:uncharacterized protein
MRRALIVLVKDARPGQAKARLIPAIGAAAAAGLYRAFVQDVLDAMAVVRAERFLYGWPPESLARLAEIAEGRFIVRPQLGPTTSERMVSAFSDCFAAGFGAVVMRNSDSPTLPVAVVGEAFDALESGADLVLGPDRGGSYQLVGLRAPRPELFRGFTGGTTSVLDETLRRAAAAKLRVQTLRPWLGVDEGDDLLTLRAELDPANGNERAACPRTEAFLATLPAWRRDGGKTLPPAAPPVATRGTDPVQQRALP